MTPPLVTHAGGCHCGRVRFELDAPAVLEVAECNCSICTPYGGFGHVIVPADRFRLLAGEDVLTTYRFGTRTAHHRFCSVCGVKSFYVPRSHPDGFSVSIHCIDPGTVTGVRTRRFDGRNWERSVAGLRGEGGAS
jgi:hypothetical protein